MKEFESYVDSLNFCNSQFQFDALVDFAYNCGIENLRTSTLLRYIREGRSEEEIRKEFHKWIYCVKGLAIRRKWEADRFFGRTTPFSLKYRQL